MINKFKLSFLLFLSLFISACSDDPNSIGIDQLSQDYLTFDEITIDSITVLNSSVKTINTGVSKSLLLGNYSGTEASFLVKFAVLLQDSIKEMVNQNSISVSEAYIEMYPNYRAGSGELSNIEVYEVLRNWQTFNFNSDSLIGISGTENLSDSISVSDTLYRIKIKNDLILNWLKSSTDASIANNGILVKSTDQNLIRGFQSIDGSEDLSNPFIMQLKVKLQKSTGSNFDLNFAPLQDVHVATLTDNSILNDQQYMYLQSGVAINGNLKFDLAKLPTDIIINDATLEFTYDSLKSFFGIPAIQQLNVSLLDSTNQIAEDVTLFKSGVKFRGSVNRIIQTIMLKKSEKELKISLVEEHNFIDRIAIYSDETGIPEFRPKLIIRFSKLGL